MSIGLDPSRYPRTYAYLETLPEGIDSYSSAGLRAEALDSLRAAAPTLSEEPGLLEPVRDVLQGRVKKEWISEVLGNAVMLSARDRSFGSDEAFLRWGFESSSQLFKRPLFRVLMLVMSPSLTVLNAAKRWHTFHQGSELIAAAPVKSGGRVMVRGTLKYPTGLYPELVLKRWGRAFEAAISATRAREAAAVLARFNASEAEYEMSWLDV